MQRLIRTKQRYLAAVGLLAVIAMAWWWFGRGAGEAATTRIDTSPVDRGDIVRTVATSGAVRALVTVEVGSQLSGQIADLYADFNSPVTKDQVIALIDPKTFETRVLQNAADLKVAEANVTVQQAGISRAEANLRRARLDYERSEPLVRKGTLPQSDLDTSLAAFESAKADLKMAQAQLQNALANKEQRQATLESVRIDLERTKIRSPIDGVVIERVVNQGQTVAASLSSPVLFRIAQDLTRIRIEANVDEADIGNVKQGNPVSFTVDAYPDEEFSGMVDQVRLAPTELQNVVTYTVIISARNPELKLFPGMTAIVEIVTGKSEAVMRVANEAVRFRPPEDSPLFSQTAPATAGGAPGGPRRMDQELESMAAALQMSEDQIARAREGIGKLVTDMRSRFASGGSANGFPTMSAMQGGDADAMRERMARMREQMAESISQVYRDILTPEQFSDYQQLRRQQQETRMGQIWIQSRDGKIQPVMVRLGISDDSYTRIVSGDVKEGDKIVTRLREISN
jgi:HlyD family secretion protein